jgi:cytochrome c-type biogenesis protein CcmE
MNLKQKRQLYFVLSIIIAVAISAALALYALKQNINLYYTPQEIKKNKKTIHLLEQFRLGGMVVKNSVHHWPDSLKVDFVLTDFSSSIPVFYDGILPDLFREGQGIVAQGKLNAKGVFVANEVLAKHDENYHPPKIPQPSKKAT